MAENSLNFNDFDSIKVGLCSPESVLSWSYGEVKKPETINYRTQKPEKDGLFCEKIFGPQKDWECHCGKYKRIRYKGVVCDRCGVEVTKSKVRRERMGHITLATPVSHIWYFKGIPSRMGLILDISPKYLENVLYFASYIVTEVKSERVELKVNQVLTEAEYREAKDKYGDKFEAGMGAEAIKKLLSELNLDELSKELKKSIEESSGQGQKRAKQIKRLEAVESFRMSGNKPEPESSSQSTTGGSSDDTTDGGNTIIGGDSNIIGGDNTATTTDGEVEEEASSNSTLLIVIIVCGVD